MNIKSKLSKFPGERLSLRHVRDALAGITRISALIHRVRLSVPKSSLQDVTSVIGTGKVYPKTLNKWHQLPQYNKVSYHTYREFATTLYSSPRQQFLPNFMLILNNHNQGVLSSLAKGIPDLKVSSAEYAIDVYCKEPASVSRLYYILRRYMYFPRRMRPTTVGGKFNGIYVDRETNSAYYVWQRAKSKKDIVVYERGDDAYKKNKGWPYNKIDRVRIEFLIRSRKLSQFGISELAEFVKDNKFNRIIKDRFRFCRFENSQLLPSWSQDYNSKDLSGNCESFQQEFVSAKGSIKNIGQYIQEFSPLAGLRDDIQKAVCDFEAAWKEKFKNNFKKNCST